MAAMQVDETQIDESLYSRQLYVLGHEAMKRMAASNVLIVGVKGLGVEIAKNIALAGVKSVTVYDPFPVEIADLGSQFFLREADVGKSRGEVTVPRLAELNSYVPVHLLEGSGEISPSMVDKFQVVVLTNTTLSKQTEIDEHCHEKGIAFIAADVRGLFGYAFNDLGPKFTCVDPTGENPLSGIIADIDQDKDAVVTCLDEQRHGLEDGDFVTFTEVKGMTQLNDSAPRKVTVKGPYTFTIGDTTGFESYKSGGLFTQVKMPKDIAFKPLKESLRTPEYFMTDYAKFDRPATLHVGFQALSVFVDENGSLPRSRNAEDSSKFIEIAKKVKADLGIEDELNEKVLTELSYQARGELPPMCAVLGGFVAQEVLKACSAKFHPMVQSMYFDSLESLPDQIPTEEDCVPTGSRYDSQVAVFGKTFQRKIQETREFLVGSGAIGCEMLKNWSMMGLGSVGQGNIQVTDLDTIEKSNLNRQFLFRAKDLGKFKAESAAAAVAEMNPDLKGRIISHQDRVGEDTENKYGDDFFSKLDGVTNALDNVAARQYMDRRCVYYQKPLLESGTLGTKANTQVVLPFLTESYSSSQDPPEKSIPSCTVKNFPNAIEHTIQWAREQFDALFVNPASNVNLYLTQSNYVDALKSTGQQYETLRVILEFLKTNKPTGFEECIKWARLQFEEDYNNNIQQLLYNLPRDQVTSTGQPFWSGPKRAPDPLEFSAENPVMLDYIIATAHLHAFNYGLKASNDPEYIKKILATIEVPKFVPKEGVKIQVTENEPVANESSTGDKDLDQVLTDLPKPSDIAGFRLTPVDFEKDDDTNYHIAQITSASNLRAIAYGISPATAHSTKQIAGKIIPAIATTTALATGLVCLELYKIIDGKKDLEQYKNGFVNLALPFISFSEPIAPPSFGPKEKKWTLWSRFDVQETTLKEFIDHFEKEEGLTISMISSGVSMLWSSFTAPAKVKERLPMQMSQLIETVSKKAIPAHQKAVIVEIMAEDAEGEDVETPYVLVHLNK